MASLLTVKEAAELLKIGRRRCCRLLERGTLPGAVRLGARELRVEPQALQEWIRNGGQRQPEG